MANEQTERIRKDGWPCACFKRNKAGRMTHIKLNAPELAKCPKCKCTRDMADQAMKQAGS